MAEITGELNGYTYVADWIRIGIGKIHCSATIKDPNGIRHTPKDIELDGDVALDEHAESAARFWIEARISGMINSD